MKKAAKNVPIKQIQFCLVHRTNLDTNKLDKQACPENMDL